MNNVSNSQWQARKEAAFAPSDVLFADRPGEMQMEQILTSNIRLEKAKAILDELNQYISAR